MNEEIDEDERIDQLFLSQWPEIAHCDWVMVGNNWSDDGKDYLGKILMLNMSDTFIYACADSEEFKPEDFPELLKIYEDWGDIGHICWAAKKRGYDPCVEYTEDKVYQDTWRGLYGDLKLEINVMLQTDPNYRWSNKKLDLKPHEKKN